ncbi:protein disulfide isomerase [Rhodocollybia butyracea]|uniref:protein disulfide-isomerase n=1 Tax=Rhodocollybia butyracea TaxID=206335 RepID=A0A9P5U5D7_9AGAR|nr:protein disulfide isomerase [Rhodocollybia butyracea]
MNSTLFFMYLSFSLVLAALAASVRAGSNVIDLDPASWDDIVGNGRPGLVAFYAPWCGHSQTLAPIYEEVADAYSYAREKLFVGRIDADGVGRDLARQHGITGYPTLKWFAEDGTVTHYKKLRDLQSMTDFITSMTDVEANLKPPAEPTYKVLDSTNFDDVIMDADKDAVVIFTTAYAMTKPMARVYREVAAIFANEPNCIFAFVDAELEQSKELKERFQLSAYPTYKYFLRDDKTGVSFPGSATTEEDFVTFLNAVCMTHRSVDGGLLDTAGRIADLDALAYKFFVAPSPDARDAIYKKASSISAAIGGTSKHYIHFMDRMVNGTEAFHKKESRRLEIILKKRALSSAKLDDIKLKSNILRAFTEKPAKVDLEEEDSEVHSEVHSENSESNIRKATAEL